MLRFKKGMVFSLVVICLSLLTVAFVTEAKAQTCYRLYFNWDYPCFGYYTTWDFVYVLVYPDFTFDTSSGGTGNWDIYGSSLFLQYWTGCEPLFAGTKKQGFMNCTDGSSPGADFDPGCWCLKKAKFFECALAIKEGTGSNQGTITDRSSTRPKK